MSDLERLQTDMTRAILTGNTDRIARECRAGSADAGQRLVIFRNNAFMSLTECLKTVFPVTVRLSDERFFAYAAHRFVADHPPQDARLSRYGGAFPDFLASFPPCRSFPVIAEMAAFEWAIAETQNEAAKPAVPLSAIEGLDFSGGPVRFLIQPGLRFLISRWPLVRLWQDHRNGQSAATEGPDGAVRRIALFRLGTDIFFLDLARSRFAFWRALARGSSIGTAAYRAFSRDPRFDLLRETDLLFRNGLVTGISRSQGKE